MSTFLDADFKVNFITPNNKVTEWVEGVNGILRNDYVWAKARELFPDLEQLYKFQLVKRKDLPREPLPDNDNQFEGTDVEVELLHVVPEATSALNKVHHDCTALKDFAVPTEMGTTSGEAFERFKVDNNIELLDLPYKFNKAADDEVRTDKPWRNDPNYFDKVKVSTLALLKMVTHARSGGDLEIMGMLQGRVEAHTFYVVDVFALPVEGTETRVNAQTEAYEYMARYTDLYNKSGNMEKVVGWYHSHPGYGCWLSGIDVETQHLNQQFTEPFLAIVVDPVRTLSSGKVDIGAFRTYPDGHQPSSSKVSGKFIPMNKADDFGHHCNRYYQLEVSYYMSTMDTKLLKYFWNSYWVQTLSGNKLGGISSYLNSQLSNIDSILQGVNTERSKGERTNPLLSKCGDDSRKLVTEAANGLLQEYFKRSFCSGPSEDNPVCKQDVEPVTAAVVNNENA